MGDTAGEPALLLKTGNISCSAGKPLSCNGAAATTCATMTNCVAFTIKDKSVVSYFKEPSKPAVPAEPTKQFYAVPCNPVDKNQEVKFKADTEGVGQLVTANGLCADVGCDPETKTAKNHAPLALKPCADQVGQQWKHLPGTAFQSQCGHACLDLYEGGRSDEAGLYSCDPGIWCADCECGDK